ncbi:uncharacterized protein LOC120988914 isoform X1 [Bufo bufo]|uniref:uncharacterized protein LOC120988914 isoform X1 n=1 Tax=Bufo bufo TaxID=8384 RepID=UPI001ABDA843|nr:uncharacterized protein LOC120988914 isoform X1 [Bufo bufo]
MVGRFKKCQPFSGFLHGIFLLLTLSANCNSDILHQTKAMLREMQQEAEELFNESFTEHDIPEDDCRRPYPNTTDSHKKSVIHRINESLLYFSKAFDVLLGRHEVSEYEHTVILTKERMKIKGLRSNLLTLLKQYNDSLENMLDPHMCKMLKTKFRLPNSEDIYGQKLECCQLINVYIDFLKVIHKIVLKLPSRRLRHFFTNYMLI